MLMQPATAMDALRLPSREEAEALRRAFASCGFTAPELVAKLGDMALPTRRAGTLPRLMRLTAGGAPLDTLARLFLLSVPVPAAAAEEALGPQLLETAGRLGLVERFGAEVAGKVIVHPYGSLLVAFDAPGGLAAGAPRDMVMGISASSINLANFTVHRPVRNALDLGAGSGLQALLAAVHAERVCAVDYCHRAVSFARFNAALNGLENVECLHGDRFAPVSGRRFDLVAGNLPYVIGPAGRYLYRDGGMPLDGFCQSVVREAPGYLEEGGICQLTCEWAHVAGQDWRDRLSSWFEGTGCDAWVVKISSTEPLRYAEMWIRDTEPDDPAAAARLFDEWAEYFDRHRVESIGNGLIAMRRAPGRKNWFAVADCPGSVPEAFSDRVLRAFALHDFLNGEGEGERLMEARLSLSGEARLASANELAPGGWRVAEARLTIPGWPGHEGVMNHTLLQLVSLLDGGRTLREAVAVLAGRLGGSAGQAAQACLPVVRQLVAGGFLLPRGLAL
jgi:methylase of polypeptide subunit release factors